MFGCDDISKAPSPEEDLNGSTIDLFLFQFAAIGYDELKDRKWVDRLY